MVRLYVGAKEHEKVKKNYVKHTDAFACLGILRVNEGEYFSYYMY